MEHVPQGSLPAHTHASNMNFPLQVLALARGILTIKPADVNEKVNEIASHFRGRVPAQRLVTLAHTAVVEDEAGVLVAFLVAEVAGLPFPGRVKGA
jgi:hypothetical protein